jgi:hypothetical protein
MKKNIFALALPLMLTAQLALAADKALVRKPASACSDQVQNAAVKYAEKQYSGLCSASKPAFGRERTDSDASQIGSIVVVCHAHVSPVSVITRDYSLDFSTGAACGDPFKFGESETE